MMFGILPSENKSMLNFKTSPTIGEHYQCLELYGQPFYQIQHFFRQLWAKERDKLIVTSKLVTMDRPMLIIDARKESTINVVALFLVHIIIMKLQRILNDRESQL